MCGINGFTWRDPGLLRKMHELTSHRGPDDQGLWETESVSFAHNRLSIIDLTPGGHQPMASPDGRFTIVFNGEIYNYRELRAELEGMGERFTSTSDTEVLLRMFSRLGEACLPRLNGIFAFALWDRDEKSLRLVRDQIGVKPLYYFFDGKQLAFSSEMKALLPIVPERKIDKDALNAYFRLLYVPGEKTMVEGIKRLSPGHVALFQNGKFTVEAFWKLQEGERVGSYEDAVEGVRERLRSSVARQLVSDRPVGVFLSGGIDSSAILGLASEASSGPLKAFTVSYASDFQQEKYNADAELAARTAKHFGAEHQVIRLDAMMARDLLETTAWQMDEPVANHIQTSTYALAKFAKPEITVALGGDGGDELFGGYPRYWYAAQIDKLQKFPFPWSLFDSIPKDSWKKLAANSGLDRHLSFVAQKEIDIESILKGGMNDSSVTAQILAPYFVDSWKDKTNGLMAADVRTWIPDESLIRTDRLTMAHGLEQRVPILDIDLVEYAFRIPSKYKLGDRKQGKRVLIDAMKPWIAPHLLAEEKRAWNSPMAKWIRGPLEPYMREILSPSYVEGTSSILDFEGLNRMLDAHISQKRYALAPLWAAVSFQLWYKKVFSGK
ncbi:asparagine synthase (glutamine-hydrolyzing) [Candidatus Uhrbacteria bacterium]|nr:asparagine synthase (glutamine-hydrolyzing) [Candidatus Uhrbacteria bacterium]